MSSITTQHAAAPIRAGATPAEHRSSTPLDRTIDRAVGWLHRHQNEDGFWVGMLESNCCMEAEWIMAMHVLGVEDDPKYEGVVRAILSRQRQDGAWQVYHGSHGGDINTTVECYAALRIAGLSPDSDPLTRARRWILDHGGLAHIRNFTKYWLCLVGEWSWEKTPALPPEMILLPRWAPFNIYQFASWARGTMIPLAILCARRTRKPLPPEKRLDELFPDGRDHPDFNLKRRHSWFSWEGPFYLADRMLRLYRMMPIKPGREAAIRLCLEWVVRHQDADGAWSGIQPPWIYALMALNQEGYPTSHPVLQGGLRAFDAHWSYQRHGGTFLQASESPIWDTVLALQAMLDCGRTLEDDPSMARAVDWMLDQQVLLDGDWSITVRGVAGGGWAFQRANRYYPDVDDTAVILGVLARIRDQYPGRERIDTAIKRGTDWVLAMQCRNGGWAAFDRDNTHPWLTRIPFADFGELIDPPSVDVTAHVVEALALQGWSTDHPVFKRALSYIRSEQETEGSWFGRWGVNHIYGTASVLPALRAAGFDMNEPWIRKAVGWVIAHQNDDGGWGESCASYMDDKLRGVGPSTASQTGWALMAILAADHPDDRDSIERGLAFLEAHQREDGTWDEPEYTGTGFPGYGVGQRIDLPRDAGTLGQGLDLERAFMINYNLYRHYFPLAALGRARGRPGR
ncbi:MAG: squalene--hopene cyclase [Phycisphaeraceae bacterium]|nr:squalene--hopene cyclase [Phycisphaeraceae bacterium]